MYIWYIYIYVYMVYIYICIYAGLSLWEKRQLNPDLLSSAKFVNFEENKQMTLSCAWISWGYPAFLNGFRLTPDTIHRL